MGEPCSPLCLCRHTAETEGNGAGPIFGAQAQFNIDNTGANEV
jgi:hypothetical protein